MRFLGRHGRADEPGRRGPSWREALLDEQPLLDERSAEHQSPSGSSLADIQPRIGRRGLAVLAALAALALSFGLLRLSQPAAASGHHPVSWSKPKAVDTGAPYSISNGVVTVSCASSTLCAGSTEFGDILTSKDPTGTSSKDWSILPASLLASDSTAYSLDATSCAPGTGFCALAGGYVRKTTGYSVVISSSEPGGAASDWTVTDVSHPISEMQCLTATTCIAVTDDGYVMSSASGTWTASNAPILSDAQINDNDYFDGLSCPDASLCVAAVSDGTVYYSTTPADLSSWTNTAATGLSDTNGGVSCSSDSYCVALSSSGSTAYSTDPGSGSWTENSPTTFTPTLSDDYEPIVCPAQSLCLLGSGSLYGSTDTDNATFNATDFPSDLGDAWVVGCAGTQLCVAGTGGGDVSTSTDPSAGASSKWSKGLSVAPGLNDVSLGTGSCPSSTLCVGDDDIGRVFTISSKSVKKATADPNVDYLEPVVCASTKLCVTADSDGRILSSTKPGGGRASDWKRTRSPVTSAGIGELACPSSKLCVGFDYSGKFISSTDPGGGKSSDWKRTSSSVDKHGVEQIVCPSTKLCVAFDYDGHLIASTHPGGGKSSDWKVSKSPIDKHQIDEVACPSAKLCVGSDSAGKILVSTNPGKASSWKLSHSVIDKYDIGQLVCPSTKLCVAYDYDGRILTSTHPSGLKGSDWKVSRSPLVKAGVRALACQSSGVCVATTGTGDVFESAHPTGGSSAWFKVSVDKGQPLPFLACAARGLCVVSDTHGKLVIGRT